MIRPLSDAAPAPSRSQPGPTDAALIVAVRAGEAWATQALFLRYARMVNCLCYRLLGRDDGLDDLVQEVFTQALSSLDRLEDSVTFGAWLKSISIRTAHKVIRRRRLLRRLGFGRDEPTDVDGLVSSAAPPDVATELHRIYRRIEQLPPKVRIPLVLRRVEEMSMEEICEITGQSLATVKRRLAEAEELLAEGDAS